MKLTIIVPAFNEEAYLAPTLDSIRAATDYLRARSDVDADASIEVIVVDNVVEVAGPAPVAARRRIGNRFPTPPLFLHEPGSIRGDSGGNQ